MVEVLIGTVKDNNGLVINVYATESGGNTTFRIDVAEGYADLRGFFFDYGGGAIGVAATGDNAYDQNGNLIMTGSAVTASYMGTSADGNDITKVGSNDNNLNGTGEVFDAGLEFGSSGIGKNDIGSVTFTINNLTLSEIDGLSFGIRATSVGTTLTNRDDSVKLIGEFDVTPSDTTPPTVVVDIVDTSLFDGDNSSEVTFTFSEAPVGFSLDDITAVGGTVTGLTATADPLVYTAIFTADDDFDGTGSVTVGTAWQDAAGNDGIGDDDSVDIDTVNPTVVVDIVTEPLSDSTNSSTVTFEFSEEVDGFDESDVSLSGGTLSNFQKIDGDTYTATFTATDGIEATGSVSVAAGSYTDLAGNLGGAADDDVTIDTLNPTVVVDIVDTSLFDGDNSSEVTFTFGEAPVGFSLDDITAVGGTVTGLTATADPLVYTAIFTADDDFDGTGSVTVGTAWQDAAGNDGIGDDDSVDIDTVNPTVVVDIVTEPLSDSTNSSTVTFEFSEEVDGFDESDVSLSGGTLSNFQKVDGDTYTATFTATDGIEATGSVSVAAGSYTDLAGNLGGAADDDVTIDTLNPTVVVDIVDTSLFDGDNSSEVTFTFSEAPVGFSPADITAVGGTVTGLTATADPLVYTAIFTADDDFDGTGSVTVGTAWQDAAGNDGIGDDDSVDIDTVNPTVVVDIVDTSLFDGDNSSEVTFTFSEAPVGFSLDDITAVGGTVTGLTATADPLVYTAIFTADDDFDGTGSVTVGTAWQDAAGNDGIGDDDSVDIDTVNPTVVVDIVTEPLSDSTNSSTVTFEFSEEVDGFDESDVSLSGGTLSNFQKVDGDTYTATFTATDGIEATGSVSVAAGSYTDLAGNLGGAADDDVTIDTLNPTVVVDIVDTSLFDGDNSSEVTFTFSEAPVGFSLDDITAVGGTVTGLTATADPLVYTAIFTADDDFDGTGSVSVAAGSYTDLAGNLGGAGSDDVIIDTENPIVLGGTIVYRVNPFTIPEWALLHNDGDAVSITGYNPPTGMTIIDNGDTITITDTMGVGGNFTYTAVDAAGNVTTSTVNMLAKGNSNPSGTAGDDIIDDTDATSTSSTLSGFAGNDVMFGHGGDDILIGGEGADVLVGGSGDDTFRYTTALDSTLTQHDVLKDFTAGGTEDEIDLDAFNFTGTAIADIKETSPAAFTSVDTANFFDVAGVDRAVAVEYFDGDARVYVDADKNGDFSAANDLVIELENVGVNSLTISDFVF